MNRLWTYLLGAICLHLLLSGYTTHFTQPIYLDVPKGWPKPFYDT